MEHIRVEHSRCAGAHGRVFYVFLDGELRSLMRYEAEELIAQLQAKLAETAKK